MPPQQGKSAAFAKLKNDPNIKKAFETHKADDTTFGAGGDLPAGIDGGVARLVTAKIDEHKDGDNKGKLFLLLSGVVVSPVRFKDENGNDIKTEGKRINKMVGLYARPKSQKTVDDQIGIALNEMRKVGIETRGLTVDDWEAALAALESEGPYFSFRTWKGTATPQFPNPSVNYDFQGVTDYAGSANGDSGVEDGTGGDAGNDEGTGTTEEEPDWDSLGVAGDGGDEDAQRQITERGTAVGVDCDAYNTWEEAASAVKEAIESGGTADATEAPWAPDVGDVYSYQPKGQKKKTDWEVTAVDPKKKTCSLKSQVDGKVLKGLPWTEERTIGGESV